MPELSRFLGMVVQMYADDHPGPHFHIRYEGQNAAVFYLRSMRLRNDRGRLPASQARAIRGWAELHEEELLENWERLERYERTARIPPLH
ncbi:MAG: DUF4160 domain-containing protein [Dehalococcoidia bacterium]|nr:DUF4160 domain-containing protein [Dehalococcoidia bacterium]